ncbi:MAG: hypothetical protein Q7W45_03735 [Bacteroidota bacterium]|nr:hypothetical protein [Bacteroidota bacterium]MDP3143916.1 hypothetical protein [Bacteroidota bacterium]MDP3558064.1 hypothetical protein [Bacteroidota bacterium]
MNKSKILIKLIGALIFFIGISFTACKKQEIHGPKGEAGDPGIGGNANITSTNIFIVNTELWVVDTATASQNATLNFPELTQKVVDKGTVKVYKQNGTVWNELPYDQGDLFTQCGFDVGHLYLNFINIEGSPAPPAPATANFRMVIISEL